LLIGLLDVRDEAYVIVVKDDSFYVGKVGLTSQLEKYSMITRSLQQRYVGHRRTVLTLSILEDTLFSGSADQTIIRWNEKNGQIIRYYDHTSAVEVLTIFDNYLFSSGQENKILKWNIKSGIVEKTFPKHHGGSIRCLAFEQGLLYSGSVDGTVIKWDLNTSSRISVYKGRKSRFWSLLLWKTFVIAGGESDAIKIQDKSQNSIFPVEIISGHSAEGIVCMTVLNDSLFTGGVDSTIRRRSLIDHMVVNVYYGNVPVLRKLNF
jgi:WD40 repeat protein